jgi:hypothetical protein
MRTIVVASLLAFTAVGVAYAAADSLDKAAKKTGDGFGELLKGMGQEFKKTGIGNEAKKSDKKKDGKKASKKSEPEGK